MPFKFLSIPSFMAAVLFVAASINAAQAHETEHSTGASGHGAGHEAGHGAGQSEDVIKIGGLEIAGAWSRATVKTAKVGAGYLIIRNQGASADQLVSATTEMAGRTEFHQMILANDVMQMRPIDGPIDIPVGGEIMFEPGGQHLMFLDLKSPFVEGAVVTVRLKFAVAGEVEVPFKIGSLAAKGPHAHQH